MISSTMGFSVSGPMRGPSLPNRDRLRSSVAFQSLASAPEAPRSETVESKATSAAAAASDATRCPASSMACMSASVDRRPA